MKDFKEELRKLRRGGLLRKLTIIEPLDGCKISINGRLFINFSSNDYLGLSRHPEIVKTAVNILKRNGLGSGASRLLSGTYSCHKRLEDSIARFKKTQRAIVFNSGYAANTGVIPAICSPDTLIFSDALNHASIIDGIRLSRVEVRVYRHRDVNHLESLLKAAFRKKRIKRRLIITDTVFSMDGDIAPLKDIIQLSKKYDALLMIDDAHGTGVLGRTGRGALEYLGLDGKGTIQMGTFSKALGVFGAFIAGQGDLIEFLVNRARSFIYSTSLPPPIIEACIKAMEIIDSDAHILRERLWRNRQRLYKGITGLGYNTLNSETQIIPVLIGSIEDTVRLSKYLYKNRIFAPAIRPPTVPQGECRIRFSVTALHRDGDIDLVLRILEKFKKSKRRGGGLR